MIMSGPVFTWLIRELTFIYLFFERLNMQQSRHKQGALPAELDSVVGGVLGKGSARYVSTYLNEDFPPLERGENITFSLTDWKGDEEPRKGEIVRLTKLRLFVKGWRSLEAFPVS